MNKKGRFRTLALFIRLGRPKFLYYTCVLQALGAICAVRTGATFDLSLFVLGQASIWTLHVMTHYCNEYFDLESDQINNANTGWTGGSRVLVEGHFKASLALKTAIFLGCTGIFMQILFPLIHPQFAQGREIALLALIWAWEYSAPPLRLHSRGLGEVTVAGIVTGLTPLYGAVLQSGSLFDIFSKSSELILALFPIMLTQVGRMIVMNIPDVKADQAVGKKTFVVQVGVPFAINIYLAIQALAYGALPFLYRLGLPMYVIVGFLAAAPLGIHQGVRLYRGDWKSPELLRDIPFQCTMHVFSTAAFVTLGFMTS